MGYPKPPTTKAVQSPAAQKKGKPWLMPLAILSGLIILAVFFAAIYMTIGSFEARFADAIAETEDKLQEKLDLQSTAQTQRELITATALTAQETQQVNDNTAASNGTATAVAQTNATAAAIILATADAKIFAANSVAETAQARVDALAAQQTAVVVGQTQTAQAEQTQVALDAANATAQAGFEATQTALVPTPSPVPSVLPAKTTVPAAPVGASFNRRINMSDGKTCVSLVVNGRNKPADGSQMSFRVRTGKGNESFTLPGVFNGGVATACAEAGNGRLDTLVFRPLNRRGGEITVGGDPEGWNSWGRIFNGQKTELTIPSW